MRVVALIAAYNEARFIVGCLEHLTRQGVDVYLIDNESDDDSVALARPFVGRGLIGIESFPRRTVYPWRGILERKEQLAAEIDADWFLHVDADEIRLPPHPRETLSAALADVDRAGFNAVNFFELTFVPTRQSPDHDHPEYMRTMRWYYPHQPGSEHQLKAWKKPAARAELAWSAGHRVRFPGLRPYPLAFPMRHYLFLSVAHAVRKYVDRAYDPAELAMGWHRARARLRAEDIELQDESELRYYLSDATLDCSGPLLCHPLFAR